jgi:hypothetical protein
MPAVNNKNIHPTAGVVLSKRIEHAPERIVKIQPPEMIHCVHLDSLARITPTIAAGAIASPIMASKVTADSVADI